MWKWMTEQKEGDILTIQFPTTPDKTDLDGDSTYMSGPKAVLWTERLQKDLQAGTLPGKHAVTLDLLTRVQAVSIVYQKGLVALEAFLDTIDASRVKALELDDLTETWVSAIAKSTVDMVTHCLRSGVRTFGARPFKPRGWTPATDWFGSEFYSGLCAADMQDPTFKTV